MARRYEDDDEDDIFSTVNARQHRRRLSRDYDDDDIRDDDPEDELISILKSLDYTRQRLNCHQDKLSHLLRRYPDLQDLWRRFIAVGGVSAEDFRQFLKGELR